MEFKDWLIVVKKYSERSARDAVSRLKRVEKITGEQQIGNDTINNLDNNECFQKLSVSVKSQMRRSVRLYNEYTKEL